MTLLKEGPFQRRDAKMERRRAALDLVDICSHSPILCASAPPRLCVEFFQWSHFKANSFKKRFLSETFIHVFTARHRPQSNSIAERFVRTLKEWLEPRSWSNDQELAALLKQFHDEYNDRPHQGLATPGLSPNEFARRVSQL